MHLITLLTAKYLYLLIGVIAFGYWLTLPKRQKVQVAIFGLIAAIVAYGLAKIGGALYFDPRPFVFHNLTPLYPHTPDNGFPSDHTLLSAFIAVTIYAVHKRLGLILMAMALLVGGARVIGNIHSPIDIAGSVVFALLGGFVAYYLTPKVLARVKT